MHDVNRHLAEFPRTPRRDVARCRSILPVDGSLNTNGIIIGLGSRDRDNRPETPGPCGRDVIGTSCGVRDATTREPACGWAMAEKRLCLPLHYTDKL